MLQLSGQGKDLPLKTRHVRQPEATKCQKLMKNGSLQIDGEGKFSVANILECKRNRQNDARSG